MGRERALRIRAIIVDVTKRQTASSPQSQALQALMPEAFDHLMQHIAGNAAMLIDADLDEPLDTEPANGTDQGS